LRRSRVSSAPLLSAARSNKEGRRARTASRSNDSLGLKRRLGEVQQQAVLPTHGLQLGANNGKVNARSRLRAPRPPLFPPGFLRSLFSLMRGYSSSIRFPTLCGALQGWQTDVERLSPFPPSGVAMRRHPSFLRGDVLRNKTGGNCELLLQGQLFISPPCPWRVENQAAVRTGLPSDFVSLFDLFVSLSDFLAA